METQNPSEQAVGGINATETPANAPENKEEGTPVSELDLLKKRATMMGISFSNNIREETLRKRINAKLNGETVNNEEQETPQANALVDPEDDKPKLSFREQRRREALKLVRCRITNLDPKKKDLPGEIFTVANDILGSVSKFIPFGEVTDDGYHIPYWIYKRLEKRRFVHIRTFKDRRTGQQRVEHTMAKEFAIELLPQLTQEELDKLGAAQRAAGGLD